MFFVDVIYVFCGCYLRMMSDYDVLIEFFYIRLKKIFSVYLKNSRYTRSKDVFRERCLWMASDIYISTSYVNVMHLD